MHGFVTTGNGQAYRLTEEQGNLLTRVGPTPRRIEDRGASGDVTTMRPTWDDQPSLSAYFGRRRYGLKARNTSDHLSRYQQAGAAGCTSVSRSERRSISQRRYGFRPR